MTLHDWLNVTSAVAGYLFTAVFLAAWMITGIRADRSVRALTVAIILLRAAAGAASIMLMANAMDVPVDGYLWPLISGVTLSLTGVRLAFVENARRRRGEQAAAEAERCVRDYLNGK